MTPGYSYRLEDEIREVVRLRQGMTDEGLAEDAVRRGFATLRLFKRFCDGVGASPIIATATSAVRDAVNGAQFVERVHAELGLELRVLDGEREAYYGTIGARTTWRSAMAPWSISVAAAPRSASCVGGVTCGGSRRQSACWR